MSLSARSVSSFECWVEKVDKKSRDNTVHNRS